MTISVISRERGNRAEIKADVIAVHGLDEDALDAWTAPNSCCWLRDLLPLDIPVRVLAFAYGDTHQSIFGSAQTLLQDLWSQRDTDERRERPIIFICHGLGGIIVKKALILSSNFVVSHRLAHLHSIFSTTASIIFMGTPHLGIAKDKWPLVLRKFTSVLSDSSRLRSSIEKGSETLQDLSDQFMPLMENFRVYNFWETVETTFGPFRGYIVEESSAAPWPTVESSGIDATHSQMCKFPDEQFPAYKVILAALRRHLKEAEHKIPTRLAAARQDLRNRRQAEAHEILGPNASFKDVQSATQQSKKRAYNKHFTVRMRVSDIFTGREELARELQARILPPDDPQTPSKQKRYVLHGLGGSGKTQFCLKFANDNKNKFWGVFWIDASSAETAERAFAEIGLMGNLEARPEAGLSWLTRQELPWLLVIDNADDIRFNYANYFPSGERGHILLTSRNPECKVHATVGSKEFRDLETEDAITLLLKAISRDDDVTIQEKRISALPVVKALGCLPLALSQAGAAIRQKLYALEEYLDIFSSYKRSIFSKGYSQDTDYKHTIYTTYEVSLDKIKLLYSNSQMAVDAVEILHVLAFCHFDEIPSSIFERAWTNLHQVHGPVSPVSFFEAFLVPMGNVFSFLRTYHTIFSAVGYNGLPSIFMQRKWDKMRLRNAFSLLLHHSLISQNASGSTWSMHPMVQLWARQRLSSKAQGTWIVITARILAAAVNPKPSATAEETSFRHSLIPHIDSCLRADPDDFRRGFQFSQEFLSHFVRFAAVYVAGGRWKNAIEIQELMVSQYKQKLGIDDCVTLDAMAELAQTYWNSSQPLKALGVQKTVLSISFTKLGPYDPRTLIAMDSLGRTFWLIGDRPKAASLGKESMEGLMRILGRDHPFTVNAMHNYARALAHLGHHQQAKDMLLEVLAIRSSRSGPNDPDTLETMQELGVSYLALGEVDEAERLISHVLNIRKRLLGDEHAYTLWTMNDLSKVRLAQNRFMEAVEILQVTLEIATRTLGADHVGTLMTTHNLARSHSRLEHWTDAETLFLRLIEAQTRNLKANHPDILYAKLDLASVYFAQNQMEKAESTVLAVFQAQKDALEANSPILQKTKERLKQIYLIRGKFEEVEALERVAPEDKFDVSNRVSDETSEGHQKPSRRSFTF
ncbi:Nephrocystin-3 [Talaromyces pinophilus]|nr:Nephrocystin-3 [Talaromyces pinophilus]